MALDRSKFKSTAVQAMVEQDKELANSIGRDGGSYTQYLKFENGDNLLRIYPPHAEEDGGGDAFAEPKVTAWLPMMVVEKDANGQDIVENGRPKVKESSRTVFNSRIHGNTEKDLVEQYIRIAEERLTENLKVCQDLLEKSKLEDKLHRIRGNYKLKIQGLGYKQQWVMYVDRIVGQTSTFGPIEIGPAVKERLNSLAASTDGGNAPIATDPFTNPDDGRAVLIKYNKQATRPQDYYTTELDNVTVPTVIGGKTYHMPRVFPLTDAQLEAFDKVSPLAKRFKNSFTRRDYKLQFEGLEFFDSKYDLGIFQDSEFIDVCEEIDSYYPEIEEAAATQNEAAPLQGTTPAVQQQEEYQGDMFDLMSRKELGEWHRTNRTGFIVKPTISDDDVRESARNWFNNNESQGQEESQEEEAQQEPASPEPQAAPATPVVETTTQTTASRIAEMRAKAGLK